MTHRFNIEVLPGDERFFEVVVTATQSEMVDAIDVLCYGGSVGNRRGPGHGNATASCVGVRSREFGWRGLVGYLFFSLESLNAGIVAHEIAHAGFRVIERDRVKLRHWRNGGLSGYRQWSLLRLLLWSRAAHRDEERYADVVEHMTRLLWREAHDRGLA